MKDKYSIKPVLSSECYEWFLKKHYARRLPNINCAFGLYDNFNLLQGNVFIIFILPKKNIQ